MDTSTTNQTISPKVIATGAASVAVVVVIAMLAAVTPDMLDWAGQWTPVIYAGIVALAGVLGGYVKRDPDRESPALPVGVPAAPGDAQFYQQHPVIRRSTGPAYKED